MSFKNFRCGGGENTKAEATSLPDDDLVTAEFCSFDTAGAVASAKGRALLNSESVIENGTEVTGGFDGLLVFDDAVGEQKTRFVKTDEGLFYGTVDPSDQFASTYATNIGGLSPIFQGGEEPDFTAGYHLTGFVHNGYAYFADGTGFGRFNPDAAEENPHNETWGLRSPGYHEFTSALADPLTATDGDNTITVTMPGGHGLGVGVGANDPGDYPYVMNVEIAGLESIGGIKDNDINCLHQDKTRFQNGDVTVTLTAGGPGMDTNGTEMTLTFNDAGQYGYTDIPSVVIRNASENPNLSNETITPAVVQNGSASQSEIQTLTSTVTGSPSGYWTIGFNDGVNGERTYDIPFDATIVEVQSALNALSLINAGIDVTTTAVTVVDEETYTFEVPDNASDDAPFTLSGGGSKGFMRQGPSLVVSDAPGGLVAGTYYYAYTFYNGVAESNFSAQVPIFVTDGDAVDLSNILIGPEGTTERRMYRTDVNKRQLYYIGKLGQTGNEFTDLAGLPAGADPDADQGDPVNDQQSPSQSSDNIGSSRRSIRRSIDEVTVVAKAAGRKKRDKLATNLGLLSDWTDHDPPPADIHDVGLVGETCFGISGKDVVFSENGNVEHFPLGNRFRPAKSIAATLHAWRQFDRDVIVYTDASLHRFTPLGVDFSDSRLEEIESPVGLAGPRAVAALDGQLGHLFLAKGVGIMLFDGARVYCVSDTVEPMFTDPSDANYVTPRWADQAILVTSRDRAWLVYRSDDDDAEEGPNNRILFCDFSDIGRPKFSPLPTWEYSSVWREKSDNTLVAGDYDGYFWMLDYGYSDPLAGIPWSLVTKDYQLNGGALFSVDEIVLDADFAGATTTVTVTTRGRGSTKTATFTNSTTGRQRIKHKLPTYLRGETVRAAISSSSGSKRQLFSVGWTGEFGDEP